MQYNKTSTTIQQQIDQLKSRGLVVMDEAAAFNLLENISYYRLAGYWWSMQSDKVNHIFKPNSHFENVVAIYNFDREFRILLYDVIERIEIGFRTRLIFHLSNEISPWWFEDSANFINSIEHSETLTAIDRELNHTKEVFIKEHRKKYSTDNRRPPAWKTIEVASLGNISKFYSNLLPKFSSKDAIAAELGTVNHRYLPSWIQTITQIRNICAHHGRLWNRNLPGRPKLLPKPPKAWLIDVPKVEEFHKIYVHLCCMKYLLNVISPGNHFTYKLNSLLIKYPNIDPKALGLKDNWQNEALWQA